MREYYINFLEEFDFPQKARPLLLDAFDKLIKYKEFCDLINNYYSQEKSPEYRGADCKAVISKFSDIKAILFPLCEKTGINVCAGSAAMFICVSSRTKEICHIWKWTEDMYRRSMLDIKCKLYECYELTGIWGIHISAFTWFGYVLGGVINSIGRLQFLYKEYDGEDIVIAGHSLTKGTKYIDIHIPASNESFDKKSRIEAYDKAYKYFSEVYGEDTFFFGCHSWLLYEAHRIILNEKSNVISFMNDFKIVNQTIFGENEKRRDMWRIFGHAAETDSIENLPEKTSLQRAYKKWLADGNTPGMGQGFFVYDNVKKDTLT